jgi:hypothetical protein
VGAIIVLIGLILGFFYLSSVFEHHKLISEVKSMKLSSSKPQGIDFENVPTDSEQILSSSHPGVMLKLPISQTTLGNEINMLKGVLQDKHFKVDYNAQVSPDNIIGTSKNYFINIGIEYNNSAPRLQQTNQTSTFNGEPIFAEPSSNTPVNDLKIHLEDISKSGY